mmetsp:Transcript_46852/g.134995  ORF Transcript_46852/g.134995 Transcript_46852/m.134995 type:complete len:595 (-) Transcript_46852:187-1971(-)
MAGDGAAAIAAGVGAGAATITSVSAADARWPPCAGAAGAVGMDGMEGFSSNSVPCRRRAPPRSIEAAAQKLRSGDVRAFYETLALLSIRDRPVSVTLARPQDPDCPLIGCSKGFEVLTGFRRSEILGKNCRFLNRGCTIRADTRLRLRMAIRTGDVFSGTLQNRRKDGEVFENLLYICPLRVGVSIYILGIQADMTGEGDDSTPLDVTTAELQRIADSIFSSGIAAWVRLQESTFSAVQLSHSEESLNLRSQLEYIRAREAFVAFGYDLTQRRVVYKYTFLEIYNCEDERERRILGLRRVASEPAMALPRDSPRHAAEEAVPAQAEDADAPICGADAVDFGFGQQVSTRRHMQHCEDDDDDDGEDAGQGNEIGALPAWSAGSAGHPDSCTPCSFHCYSLSGCNRGDECLFCHMLHVRRKHRRRRGRKKRNGEKDCDGSMGTLKSEGLDSRYSEEVGGFGDDAVGLAVVDDNDNDDGDDGGSVVRAPPFVGRPMPPYARPTGTRDILENEGSDAYLSLLPVPWSTREKVGAVAACPCMDTPSPTSPPSGSPHLAPNLWLAQELLGGGATTPQHLESLAPLRSALEVLAMSARLWS